MSHIARKKEKKKRVTCDFSKVEAIITITLVDSYRVFLRGPAGAQRDVRGVEMKTEETCLSDSRRGNAHTDTQTLIIRPSVLISSPFTQAQTSSFETVFGGRLV